MPLNLFPNARAHRCEFEVWILKFLWILDVGRLTPPAIPHSAFKWFPSVTASPVTLGHPFNKRLPLQTGFEINPTYPFNHCSYPGFISIEF